MLQFQPLVDYIHSDRDIRVFQRVRFTQLIKIPLYQGLGFNYMAVLSKKVVFLINFSPYPDNLKEKSVNMLFSALSLTLF